MKSARMCGNLRCNGREATARLSNLWIALCLLALAAGTQAQTLALATAVSPSASPEEETVVPTFETQKLARTYILDVPAPRGQITDRNGMPLAQNRLSYNLAINFPTPLDFSDAQALSFVREKIDKAEKLIGRTLRISDEAILRNYRNRGIMPLEIAQNKLWRQKPNAAQLCLSIQTTATFSRLHRGQLTTRISLSRRSRRKSLNPCRTIQIFRSCHAHFGPLIRQDQHSKSR